MRIGNVTFDVECYQMEVTSMHRPDTSWTYKDPGGHEHTWYPMGDYNPTLHYEVPSTVWIKTGTVYDEDGEAHDVGELRCLLCGAIVVPGYTSDDTRRFVPGIRTCTIDGAVVTPEEFEKRLQEAINKTKE